MVRRYRKRYYRKKSALKKSSIFRKKSAKSQARQIYALNKKINRVEKLTKPEVLTHNCPKCNYQIIDCRSGAEPAPKTLETYYGLLIHDLKTSQTNYGFTNFSYSGKLCRIQNMNVFHTIEMSSSPNGSYDNCPQDAYVRITYQKLYKNIAVNTDFRKLHNVYEDGPFRIKGPLNDGISGQGKIVYDKVFKLDINHTKKIIKIPFRRFTLRNADKDDYFDAGDYYYNITLYNATGYQAVPSPAIVACVTGVKLAYIDEDAPAESRGVRSESQENKYVRIS